MELISREEVLDTIPRTICTQSRVGKTLIARFVKEWICNIKAIPTIESRPKGKWVADSQYFQAFNETVTTYKCSECQGEPYFSKREGIAIYKYCPFCGADMRGEE